MQFYAEGILYILIIYRPLRFLMKPIFHLLIPSFTQSEGESCFSVWNFPVFQRFEGIIFIVFIVFSRVSWGGKGDAEIPHREHFVNITKSN